MPPTQQTRPLLILLLQRKATHILLTHGPLQIKLLTQKPPTNPLRKSPLLKVATPSPFPVGSR